MDHKECGGCWWQEGGDCYNEAFIDIHMKAGLQQGESCETTIHKCKQEGFLSKREALSKIIPSEQLIIISERNTKEAKESRKKEIHR